MNGTCKVKLKDDALSLLDDHAAYGAADVSVDRDYSANHGLRRKWR